MDPVDYIRKQVPKTKIIISGVLSWQYNSTSYKNNQHSLSSYALFLTASRLMATTGLGNLTQLKMGYT